MKLLLFDDNLQFASQVGRYLQGYGIICDIASSGSEGLFKIMNSRNNGDYDLLMIEHMLPDMSGLSIIRRCRARGSTVPIMLLSSIADVENKTKGFALGADDVMTKPFSYKELLARIHALVRRRFSHSKSTIQTGNLMLDMDSRTVYANGVNIPLTNKEYMILELLFLRKGMTISKQTFLHHLYESNFAPGMKIVDVFICKVRRRIQECLGTDTEFIKTMWGRGYKLVDIDPIPDEKHKDKDINKEADSDMYAYHRHRHDDEASRKSAEFFEVERKRAYMNADQSRTYGDNIEDDYPIQAEESGKKLSAADSISSEYLAQSASYKEIRDSFLDGKSSQVKR